MKMKRYVSADMRSALRAVREEQGPDAVILSTRSCPEGVEVCAAVDLELAAEHGSLAETAALKQLEREALATMEQVQIEHVEGGRSVIATAAQQSAQEGWPAASLATPPGTSVNPDTLGAEADLPLGAWSADDGASPAASVGEELRSLRALLEQQLAALAWNDFTRREPLKARTLADLARLGIDRALALQILEQLPSGLSPEQLQRMPYGLLARRIHCCASPTEHAGAIALIGPPGSGKTTTLAKLAARYVLEQDAANLLIICSDDERLGSYEQLACLGRLLGVRVESVIGTEPLTARIAALRGRCILIDAPGIASRDAAAVQSYRALRERCPELTTLLVLPASAQSGVIEETVTHLGPPLADCCAVTRIDEAVSLGGVISALVRSQLPVAYLCEGPRIPEDLRPARAHQLVAHAVELSRDAQDRADDDLLARRYGRSVHAAA